MALTREVVGSAVRGPPDHRPIAQTGSDPLGALATPSTPQKIVSSPTASRGRGWRELCGGNPPCEFVSPSPIPIPETGKEPTAMPLPQPPSPYLRACLVETPLTGYPIDGVGCWTIGLPTKDHSLPCLMAALYHVDIKFLSCAVALSGGAPTCSTSPGTQGETRTWRRHHRLGKPANAVWPCEHRLRSRRLFIEIGGSVPTPSFR